MFDRVAIVGVGLIGGSVGLAIKEKKIAKKVIGIGHRRESIRQALKQGAIDEGYLDLSKVKGSGLVILAAPVLQIMSILPRLSQYVTRDTLVMDVGSTKSEIIKTAQKSGLEFIGCHPLAGMEKKGPQNARSGIFKGSLCLIVPSKKAKDSSLRGAIKFWKAIGARIEVLDSSIHDRILAFVSHLPHAAAFGMLDCIKPDYLRYAASGLKDTTRIGLSDPHLWRDIFLTNQKELLRAIASFRSSLTRLESLIKNSHSEALVAYLEKARNKSRTFMFQGVSGKKVRDKRHGL